MSKMVYIPLLRIHIGRFLFLLITFVALFVLRPFLEGFIGIYALMDIFISAVVISGMYAVSQRKRTLIAGLSIGIPAIMIQWANYFLKSHTVYLASDVLGMVFAAYVSGIIIGYLFREKKVTTDVINGAICIYFLIGLLWSYIYALMEGLHPGSFSINQPGESHIQHFTYFSYVTLTTLGYGDITPISSAARSLAVLESITGQLYVAIMIARLVGIHIVQSQGDRT